MRLVTICARGGSKGVENKNIRPLMGKPLLAHTVEQALASGVFDDVAISSDSDEILDVAMRAGATVRVERPAEFATDQADKSPAILHCAEAAEMQTGRRYGTFVDLDATAPLRAVRHIREAVEKLEASPAGNLFSVCHSRRSPYFNVVERTPTGEVRVCKRIDPPPVRRQDVPATYDMNASIYAWKRDALFQGQAAVFREDTEIYVMPEYTLFDLDSEFDFQLIELLYPRVKD